MVEPASTSKPARELSPELLLILDERERIYAMSMMFMQISFGLGPWILGAVGAVSIAAFNKEIVDQVKTYFTLALIIATQVFIFLAFYYLRCNALILAMARHLARLEEMTNAMAGHELHFWQSRTMPEIVMKRKTSSLLGATMACYTILIAAILVATYFVCKEAWWYGFIVLPEVGFLVYLVLVEFFFSRKPATQALTVMGWPRSKKDSRSLNS